MAYVAVALQEYAFTDDWSLLDEAQRHAHAVRDVVILGGRPLLAVALDAGFGAAGTLGGLRALRGVAIAGIALLAVALAFALVRAGWRRSEAALVAIAAGCAPSLRLYASWTVAYVYPWAALTAVGAAGAARAAMESDRRGARLLLRASAVALLSAAMVTYQPAAAFFWVPAGVVLLSTDRPWRRAAEYVAIYGVGGAIGLLALKLGSAALGAGPVARAALASDPVEKLRWFVRGPLVDALNVGALSHSRRIAVVVGCAVLLGLAVEAGRGRRVLVAMSVAVLCMSPNLATHETWTCCRTQIALGPWVLVMCAYAVRGLARFAGRWRPLALRTILLASACASLVAAAYTVQAYVVTPQVLELAWLRHEIDVARRGGAARIDVVPPGYTAPLAPGAHYDEFGMASLAPDWTAPRMIAVLLRERGAAPIPVRVLPPDASTPAAPERGVYLLDARPLSAFGR